MIRFELEGEKTKAPMKVGAVIGPLGDAWLTLGGVEIIGVSCTNGKAIRMCQGSVLDDMGLQRDGAQIKVSGK